MPDPIRVLKRLVSSAVTLLPFLSGTSAAAVLYQAHDLPDTTLGEDLWEYRYTLTDFNFQQGQGVSIFFDFSSYSDLQHSPITVSGWDLLTIQPDGALLSDGFFDAQALVNAPSLPEMFSVAFVWLGAGAPGPQPATIYDPNFSVITAGQTMLVPEPRIALALAGTLAIFCIRRSRR